MSSRSSHSEQESRPGSAVKMSTDVISKTKRKARRRRRRRRKAKAANDSRSSSQPTDSRTGGRTGGKASKAQSAPQDVITTHQEKVQVQMKQDEEQCNDILAAIAENESFLGRQLQEQLNQQLTLDDEFNAKLNRVIRDTYDAALNAMSELVLQVKQDVKQSCDPDAAKAAFLSASNELNDGQLGKR